MPPAYTTHRDLDRYSVFVSLSRELLCFDYVLYSPSYVGSRDLVRQWPAVHDQNKQRFLKETFKTRWTIRLFFSDSFCSMLNFGFAPRTFPGKCTISYFYDPYFYTLKIIGFPLQFFFTKNVYRLIVQ